MATFDDFEGVYFTIQALRLQTMAFADLLEIIVIDNNADSPEGQATQEFCNKAGVRYVIENEIRSTAIRNRVFDEAQTEFALCIDPHVLFEPRTIERLLGEVDNLKDSPDLFHGPLLYDYLAPTGKVISHMRPEWRDNMFGTWAHDEKAKDPDADAFEIPMAGMGMFAASTKHFKRFHSLFKGFGGEEGYIHEKTRKAGGKIWCLPWLRWVHRFQRPRAIPYPLKIEERISNYFVGFKDAGLPVDDIIEHFSETQPNVDLVALESTIDRLFEKFEANPIKTLQQWHKEPAPIAPFAPLASIPRANENETIWHDTQIRLGEPLEIDVLGKTLLIEGIGCKWATP